MRGEVLVAIEAYGLRCERGAQRVLVDLAVTRHEREAERAFDVERDALQKVRRLDTEVLGDRRDPRHVGGVQLLHRWRVDRHRLRWILATAPRGFDVRGVVARAAPYEVVLAHRGDGHELVVHVAADLAGLRFDRTEREPAALEDAEVRVVHLLVARA